jgi:hypothetical protein
MLILGMIGIAFVIIGVMALMSDEKPKNNSHKKYGNKKTFWKGNAPMGYVD